MNPGSSEPRRYKAISLLESAQSDLYDLEYYLGFILKKIIKAKEDVKEALIELQPAEIKQPES